MSLVKRITVAGFRGIPTPLDITFQSGGPARSMVLYGGNGTGKSSITDAWEWLTSGRIAHLAREGAEESSYPHMRAKSGQTYMEVEFARADLGTVRLTFDPNRVRSPRATGSLSRLRQLVSQPCHVRHGDLTRFVLMTKAERYDAMATLMGFVPQMEYQKALRRVADKLAEDLRNQRALHQDVKRRHDTHFANKPSESFTPHQLLALRNSAHGITCDEKPESVEAASVQLKQLVIEDKNAKKLAAVRGIKESLNAVSVPTGVPAKIRAVREPVGELKALQSAEREKVLRIPLLQAAGTLLERVPDSGGCPLCGQTFKGDLRQHVAAELAELQRLKTLLERVRLAKDALRFGLVDNIAESPVTIPETYAPPAELKDALSSFQAKLAAWKTSLGSARDLLSFDTSALTDELVASLRLVETTIELAHQELLSAKRDAAATLEALASVLEKDPQRKKLVEDNEFVVTGLGLLNELNGAREKGVRIRKIHDRFADLVQRFVVRALDDVSSRFKQISGKVTDYFTLLERDTPGIGAPTLKLDQTQDRSVVLEVVFQGTPISPAYRYLSESQLNSFGLAVSLASATHFNPDFPFLILDDVVISCDAYKRPKVIDLLETHLAHVQVLLLTHDRFWRETLYKRLPAWSRLDFVRYDLGVGPVCEPGKDSYSRIEEDLDRDEPEAASGRFARYLEDAAQEIGEALEIDVKFNRRGEYTLDPLLTAIRSRLERKLGANHPLTTEMVRVTEDNAYRNWTVHCKNPASPITSPEIRTVVANWRAVEGKFYCPSPACHGVVTYDDGGFRCRCGATVHKKVTA